MSFDLKLIQVVLMGKLQGILSSWFIQTLGSDFDVDQDERNDVDQDEQNEKEDKHFRTKIKVILILYEIFTSNESNQINICYHAFNTCRSLILLFLLDVKKSPEEWNFSEAKINMQNRH